MAGGIFCCDFGMDFWICCDLLVLILLGIGLLEVKASARGWGEREEKEEKKRNSKKGLKNNI